MRMNIEKIQIATLGLILSFLKVKFKNSKVSYISNKRGSNLK